LSVKINRGYIWQITKKKVKQMSDGQEDLNDSTTLTMSVPAAGALLGLNRNASHAAAERGEIPTMRFGKLIRVPKAAVRRKLQEAGALLI
jgi:hypothetical protein